MLRPTTERAAKRTAAAQLVEPPRRLPASALAALRRRPARSQPIRTDRLARVRRKPGSPAAAPVAQRQRQWSQTPSSVGSNPTRGTGRFEADSWSGRFESDPGYLRG